MNMLKDYVNYKLTHADKTDEAKGYPLVMKNCKKNKKMRDLKIYGNTADGLSVGEPVVAESDINYGKYLIPVCIGGINLFCLAKTDAKEQTINGITFTPLGDERVHIKGKAIDESSNIAFYYRTTQTGNMPIKRGTYKAKQNHWTWNGLNLMFGCNNGSKGQNINSMNNSVSLDMDNGYISSLYIGLGGDALKREWDDIIELQLMDGTDDLPYEPYAEPELRNIFLGEALEKNGDNADYIDLKNKKAVHFRGESIVEEQLDITLPRLSGATSIIETGTSVSPFGMYGKYIKK